MATTTSRTKNIAIKAGDQSLLVEMLGKKLPEWMVHRELLQNSFEGIQRSGVAGSVTVKANQAGKTVVIDTGDGMPRDLMLKYLNTTLTSGNTKQGLGRNHGIGSKITTRYRNPHGLEYRTMCAGVGVGVRFAKVADQYVIDARCADGPDGAYAVPDTDFDQAILDAGSGTQVILHGASDKDRTAKYLPVAIDAMQARIWRRNDMLKEFTITTIEGDTVDMHGVSDRMLDDATDYGYLDMDGAVAHWFTFPAGTVHGLNAGLVSQAEVYHPVDGQTAKGWMAQCGIHEGGHRVAVYFEPTADRFVPNAERDALFCLDGRTSMTAWSNRWKAEFREHLPAEIIALIAEETALSAESIATFDRTTISRWSAYYKTGNRVARPTGPAKPKTADAPVADVALADDIPAETRDLHPTVLWRKASEMGEGFFDHEAGVYDTGAHTVWLDSEYQPFVALRDTISVRFGDRDDIAITVDAVLRSRFGAIAVDAYLAARTVCSANRARKVDREFNRSISTVSCMRATGCMPAVEAELRARFRGTEKL